MGKQGGIGSELGPCCTSARLVSKLPWNRHWLFCQFNIGWALTLDLAYLGCSHHQAVSPSPSACSAFQLLKSGLLRPHPHKNFSQPRRTQGVGPRMHIVHPSFFILQLTPHTPHHTPRTSHNHLTPHSSHLPPHTLPVESPASQEKDSSEPGGDSRQPGKHSSQTERHSSQPRKTPASQERLQPTRKKL